jgi:hypothetical protein
MRHYVLAAAAALIMVACGGGDTVTGPSTTTTAPQSVVPAPPATPTTPTVVASPEPGGGPGPVSVSCDTGTQCFFSNAAKAARGVTAVCTTIGQHNDWGSWSGSVPPGNRTLSVDIYDICDPVKIGIDLCKGGEQKVQVDFNNGAEHIGHWGLGGQVLKWEANKEYCEPECEYPYAGTLPGEEQARLTFIAKNDVDNLYVWRIQNNTTLDYITVKGPGTNITFYVPHGTIGFFTLDYAVAGLSIYDCEGHRLHGTASSNETTKHFCEFATLREAECPCVEEGPTTVATGSAVWDIHILDGQCAQEVDPLPYVQASTVSLDCHQDGTQSIESDYTCKDPVQGTRTLCRNISCDVHFGECYYNHEGKKGKEECEAQPGFVSWNSDNHLCQLAFPGISDSKYQLNPGQSDPDCLDKHD